MAVQGFRALARGGPGMSSAACEGHMSVSTSSSPTPLPDTLALAFSLLDAAIERLERLEGSSSKSVVELRRQASRLRARI
jgi:hypothetical protein